MIGKTAINKLILIILINIVWIFLIPGYVAYKNDVFYGAVFKARISDSLINSRLKLSTNRLLEDSIPTQRYKELRQRVVFSGFGDNNLNYIWFNTYVLLCILVSIINGDILKNLLSPKTIGIILGIYFMFYFPNWFRNTDLGRIGRTIYSFVNYDIDKMSFLLQELRGFFFAALLGIYWVGCDYELEKRKMDIPLEPNINSLFNFSLQVKDRFHKWQTHMIIIILLFLPWTWLYYKNIVFLKDSRYLFSAMIMHSFWIITLIFASRPFYQVRAQFWAFKRKYYLTEHNDSNSDMLLRQLEFIEPLPKGQLLISAVTTVFSLLAPLIQFFFS